jgi:hypothetical protein
LAIEGEPFERRFPFLPGWITAICFSLIISQRQIVFESLWLEEQKDEIEQQLADEFEEEMNERRKEIEAEFREALELDFK